MSSDHKFKDAAAVRQFVLGGNATFTIESAKTGTRFTYKVAASADEDGNTLHSRPGGVFFVSLLTGSDNETDYSYLGIIPKDDPLSFRLTKKSRAGADAPSVVAFKWFWGVINKGFLPASLSVWHEGSCGRCGRTLTVPSSIESGFGPECILHV